MRTTTHLIPIFYIGKREKEDKNMIHLKKTLMNGIIGLSTILFLFACASPISPSGVPTSLISKSATPTEVSSTQTTLPQLTETPFFIATSDVWTIQKCRRVSSVVSDHSMIWTYTGDIEKYGQVDMLLSFSKNNEIKGFLFDFGRMREYRATGCVEDRTVKIWLQRGDLVDAIILGEFPATDPRGYYPPNKKLSFPIITGILKDKNGTENLDIYLRTGIANGGTMEHRFELEGVQDDELILNASKKFIAAIAKDDRDMVVNMLQFPIECEIGDKRQTFQTAGAFMSAYDTIFGDGFKERLAMAFPNYLIAYSGNIGGIGLELYGGGGVVFNGQGRVVGIYNWQKPPSTPTPTLISIATP